MSEAIDKLNHAISICVYGLAMIEVENQGNEAGLTAMIVLDQASDASPGPMSENIKTARSHARDHMAKKGGAS